MTVTSEVDAVACKTTSIRFKFEGFQAEMKGFLSVQRQASGSRGRVLQSERERSQVAHERIGIAAEVVIESV